MSKRYKILGIITLLIFMVVFFIVGIICGIKNNDVFFCVLFFSIGSCFGFLALFLNYKYKILPQHKDTMHCQEQLDYNISEELKTALQYSKEKRHTEAFPIYKKLYEDFSSATNAFNLFQCAVYCGETELEKELYEKLKNYNPRPQNEPIELSGYFVRYYYAVVLNEVGRKNEAIEILDFLIETISKYEIMDSTFLAIRGVPSIEMIETLVEDIFKYDETSLLGYKKKISKLEKKN